MSNCLTFCRVSACIQCGEGSSFVGSYYYSWNYRIFILVKKMAIARNVVNSDTIAENMKKKKLLLVNNTRCLLV